MPLVLYYMNISPYCRSVMLLAKTLGVPLELRALNLMAGEQMKPEFIALNPQHTVPTLVDGDLVLWESRAIMTYLIGQYGKDKSLYPEDLKMRAKIDNLLYFDSGTLMQRWRGVIHPVLKDGAPRPSEKSLQLFAEALDWLETAMKKHQGKWVAGTDTPTVADFAFVAGVSTYEATNFFDAEKYPSTAAWLKRCKATMTGYQEANGEAATKFGSFIQSKIQR